MTAASDLHALAICLPVLLGRASPIARTIAGSGQGEDSPAERVQALLGAATRAQRKLATLRSTHYREVLALLATHVYGGDGPTWPETLSLALRNPDAQHTALRSLVAVRKGSGPDARSLGDAGRRLIADGEQLYADAEETPSGGEWLAGDLAAVMRALQALAEHRAKAAVTVRRTTPWKRCAVRVVCRLRDVRHDPRVCRHCAPTGCAEALGATCAVMEFFVVDSVEFLEAVR